MNRNRKTKEILMRALVIIGVLLAAVSNTKADFVFGEPENLGPAINTSGIESIGGISMDDLSFFFLRFKNSVELWVSIRVNKNDPWGASQYLGKVTLNDFPTAASSFGFLATPTTADGLECYLGMEFPGGYGRQDIWVMKRETVDDAWGLLENLGPPVNTTYHEHHACVSPDGLELYFSGYDLDGARPNGYGYSDLWVTSRATREDQWTEPINLGSEINSAYTDGRPCISPDGLLLFFDSSRPGGVGGSDLYVTRRTTLSDQWGEPMNLGPLVNTEGIEECARISADGSMLYWDSDREGGYGRNDMWQSTIEPIVDFNNDGDIDTDDLLIMIDNWRTDASLCDIGPTPLGDGVVDIEDLIVFMEYWEQENMP